MVAAETINPDDTDFSAVISKVKSASPEVVYYGGEYPQAGPLSQQAKSAGLTVPLMGGDGSSTRPSSNWPERPQMVTLRPTLERRPSRSLPPSSSSVITRPPATRTPTRPTGHIPTMQPTRSSMR